MGQHRQIDLIENDRGLAGDLYQLRIHDQITARATRIAWRSGKLHALRAVFRELGHPALFVYEALEHTRRPQRSFDLTTATELSRRAVHDALQTLAAWNLITTRNGRWVLSTGAGATLHHLAEQFGCLDAVRVLVSRHRVERAAYRRALRIVDQHHEVIGDPADGYLWPPEPPPVETETLLELLHRELGAHLIGA